MSINNFSADLCDTYIQSDPLPSHASIKTSNLTLGAHSCTSVLFLIRAWSEGRVAYAGYATYLFMFPTCVVQTQSLIDRLS